MVRNSGKKRITASRFVSEFPNLRPSSRRACESAQIFPENFGLRAKCDLTFDSRHSRHSVREWTPHSRSTTKMSREGSAMKWVISLLREEEAATAVEYAVMLALILAAIIASIASVGVGTGGMWSGNLSAFQAVGFGS
jgi:Flp pilus assembly pilin Flp